MRRLEARAVRSLVWSGDELVDWARGGIRYLPDGTTVSSSFVLAYSFDAAVATSDGEWVVVYQRLGTKALLLRNGEQIRELNRSYYHAEAYEYPVCIWRRQSGQVLIAHCPEEYCQLEIEDAETGDRLTESESEREPTDFFHSRLQINPDGTHLLSAGWVWHPWDAVLYFNIDEALATPPSLDRGEGCTPQSRNVGLAEEGSACWKTSTEILLGGSGEPEDPDEAAEADQVRLHSSGIAAFDIDKQRFTSSVRLPYPPGTMMAAGNDHAVTFFGHPRLVELETGAIVREWPELATGEQSSSIILHIERPPPLALDPANRRFAVAMSDHIAVVNAAP